MADLLISTLLTHSISVNLLKRRRQSAALKRASLHSLFRSIETRTFVGSLKDATTLGALLAHTQKKTTMMSILGPIKFCIISFLSLLTFPLALLAGLTTVLAFAILLFRVCLVYVDFLVSFIPTYIFGRHTYSRRLRTVKSSPTLTSPSLSSTSSYALRRARHPSVTSPISVEAFTPVPEHSLNLMSPPRMDRDFEGLGGWRDDDDEAWTNINSRFRFTEGPVALGQNHYRTLSGGPLPRSPNYEPAMRSPGAAAAPPVSPNMSRLRRPPKLAPPPLTAVGRDKFH